MSENPSAKAPLPSNNEANATSSPDFLHTRQAQKFNFDDISLKKLQKLVKIKYLSTNVSR
jgi:hypothetical protein